ncbi:hypothetical protein ACJRO7_008769 [Eucalyptus globulus]|uniref:Uncharacterized protein n=1 Tax=Eucalyptus globulus TaxID=34317 RepID=A0ABD3ISF5_EUCGL
MFCLSNTSRLFPTRSRSSAIPDPDRSSRHRCSREEQRRLPPKRGLIKKRIFGSIVKFFRRDRRQKQEEDDANCGTDRENCNQANGTAQTRM